MCENCQNSTFGYHITEKQFLASIRQSGLSPLIVRAGSWTASATGSFARDRAEKLPGKIAARVKDVVLRSMREGLSADAILAGTLPALPVPIDIPVTGSIDDNMQLDDELKEGVLQYCLMLIEPSAQGASPLTSRGPTSAPTSAKTGTGPSRRPAVKPVKPGPKDADPVATALLSRHDHYLYRLAESYEEWRSTVEEKITGQHVYFFVKNHKAVYQKYLSICGKPSAVAVLRVQLCHVSGHEPDGSDADAIMTTHTVLGQYLQWAPADDSFLEGFPPEERPGSNTKRWEAKGAWQPL